MYKQIAQNKRKTWFLLFIFILFFSALGYVFGYVQTQDPQGAIGLLGVFGLIAMIYGAISYFASGKITLAISKAKPIEKKDHPELYRVVENLAITAGMPTPSIYIMEDSALNAFATGRNPEHASVAITRGLLDTLTKPELEGVMAHELSHIKNYDIQVQSLTVALIGMIALLSDLFLRSMFYGGGRRRKSGDGKAGAILMIVGIVLAILSPIIAKLIHLAVSREREYLADASGALLTRHPEGLARALEKISGDAKPLSAANKATAHLYIENPLRNEKMGKRLNAMFSTHPPMEERLKRLRGMARD